jgi:hypothetical protein
MSDSNKPIYRGPGLNSGRARAVKVVFSKSGAPKLSGAVPNNACELAQGGTPAIKPPTYALAVTNPPHGLPECTWQDDDETLVKEGDGDLICIDNA